MTNETQKANLKILLVEDQAGPLESLTIVIREAILGETLQERFTDTSEADMAQRGIDLARSYSSAEEFIKRNSYDLIFLDHRLPYEDQGDLESKDFNTFAETLDGRGYYLIPEIRQRNPVAAIIGTSSLSDYESRQLPRPDYRLDKCAEDISENLEIIIQEIRRSK